MDIVTATEDHLVKKVNGGDRKFSFLCAYDRAELLRADLAFRKQKLIDNFKLAKIDGEPLLGELERFDETPINENTWIKFVGNILNEHSILVASLAKTYPNDAEAIAKSSTITLEEKAKICGLILVDRKPEGKPEDTPDPNSKTPTPY